jgi:hypothetical protein
MITNERNFAFTRQTLLTQPTCPEYQMASRITRAIHPASEEHIDNLLIRAKLRKKEKL